jgi:putative NIF3 family GTP cyclohydrolase 1 type 2
MIIQAFVESLKRSMADPWKETAIDDFLYGDPSLELKNVAVTMMATQEVLEEAVRGGCNLIITHEPLFYNHHNKFQRISNDAIYTAKEKFLSEHGLCVFHLHDNVHHPGLDYIAAGMARKLNWGGYRTDDSFKSFRMAGRTLKQILEDVEASLEPTAIRYIGNEDTVYENVIVSWGYLMIEDGVRLINSQESLVLIAGETWEWELVEYVQDAHQMGFNKALVITGHVPSEESGMEYVSSYLQRKFPLHSITYIRTKDPFKTRKS